MDDLREQRRRGSDLSDRLVRISPELELGSRVVLGQVYNAGSMPASLPGQFAVHPVRVSGAESEGGSYTTSVDTSHTLIFTVVGTSVPAVGDILIGRLIEGRWVAERYLGDTTETVVLAGCACNGVIAGTVPVALNVVAPYGGTYPLFQASDLVYRTAPVWATPFGPDASGNVHWSSAPFTTGGTGPLYYALTCLLGAYLLWMHGPDIGGTPGAGGGVGLRGWIIPLGGNRCHKPGQTFQLVYGFAPGGGTGGYPTDVVKILE